MDIRGSINRTLAQPPFGGSAIIDEDLLGRLIAVDLATNFDIYVPGSQITDHLFGLGDIEALTLSQLADALATAIEDDLAEAGDGR